MAQPTIEEEYRAKHPNSARLAAEAREIMPTGVNHDARTLSPFPVYISRAEGSRKWDVDGNEYVDYAMGHGALLLGHAHPELVKAVNEQIGQGTHYGACHELEIKWGRLVQKLVPSAERLRFTISGTEATMLALRLARAYSGRGKILKFEGHFHGWHDAVTPAILPPYSVPVSKGIPSGVLDGTVVVPCNNIELVDRTLASDPDIGAVIIEPSGASWGTVPLEPLFLEDLREVTRQRDVLLIFDEVVTGFRWAPGGVQELRGIKPDLTTLAKILAGGLPGGAVAGRADILERLRVKGDQQWDRFERTYHPGTFNANPLSAAAGVTMLELIADGAAQTKASATAAALRLQLNEVAAKQGCAACVYGDASVFHFFIGPCEYRDHCDRVLCRQDAATLKGGSSPTSGALRRSLLNNGIDLLGTGGLVSAVHTQEDVHLTVRAFASTLERMAEEGIVE